MLTTDELKGLFDVASNANLTYDASNFDLLKQVHDATSGSTTIDDLEWTYATNLGNSVGLISEFTLVLNATAGTGLIGTSVQTVPEPQSILITLIGLTGLGIVSWWWKRS